MANNENETNRVLLEKEKSEQYLGKIKGSLIGGAAGDALGYRVEFLGEQEIFSIYGDGGIREYVLDRKTGKALISDDTQMTLFTANGILYAETRGRMRGIGGALSAYLKRSYQDWLKTQEMSYEESRKLPRSHNPFSVSWLLDVPELYSRRAPGITCLSALMYQKGKPGYFGSFISNPQNNSKGCGGIMRVAPLGLKASNASIEYIDREGAETAAITHGHSLGYMPAAILVHIIHRIVYPEKDLSLKEIILEAKNTVAEIFSDDKHIRELTDIIDRAVKLSENSDNDLDNIHRLGEGWVAEETLGIAIYCALRHQNDFSAGIIAAVNHGGDSDSTGAVTGNILGAWLGYSAIGYKWKENLELFDVISEMADDLCHGCQMSEYSSYEDKDWERKYIYARWKEF